MSVKKKKKTYFERIQDIKNTLDEISLDYKSVEREKKELAKVLKVVGVHKICLEEIDDAIDTAEGRLDEMEDKFEKFILDIEELLQKQKDVVS